MTRVLVATVVTALLAARVGAWPSALVESLARDARRLLPKSLAVLMAQREREILEEAQRLPPELGEALGADLASGSIQPATLALLDDRAALALDLLRQRRVGEGVIKLGALLRVPADLSDPVLTMGAGGCPPEVSDQYYAFVASNLDKIPVVLADPPPDTLRRRDLSSYWQGLLLRSRDDSPVILSEMFSRGQVVDHRTIDYRSPVFGVASLAYSRAVNAIAATWLAVWRDARGDLTRMPVPRELRPGETAGVVRRVPSSPLPEAEKQ